jgi:transposase
VLFPQNYMKRRQGKVILVVDGHPSHTAKAVQRYGQSTERRLKLQRLPSSAPGLNPDESVWSPMKKNGVSKKPVTQNEALRERGEEEVLKITGDPRLSTVIWVIAYD